jgi:hypothetical protein
MADESIIAIQRERITTDSSLAPPLPDRYGDAPFLNRLAQKFRAGPLYIQPDGLLVTP